MIRRDDDGHWLLISQVDHARIAAEIAAVWGNERVATLLLPDQLVPAIRHHDDGWQEWSKSPRIDRETGEPRNFTEMPMREATGLWSKSIAVCSGRADTLRQADDAAGRLSDLGGLWVSRHFCWLAERALESRQDDVEECRALERFLDAQSQLQAELRRQAVRDFEECDVGSLIEIGFRYLQFFDGLSLWLCCAERSEPLDFELPDGQTVRLDPQSSSRITVTPYPLSVERLELAVQARRIPIRRFLDDNDLHAALRDAPQIRLEWRLDPAG